MNKQTFQRKLNKVMDGFDELLKEADLDQTAKLNMLGKEISRASVAKSSRMILNGREKK